MNVWGRFVVALLVFGCAGSAFAADRTADEIVKEIQAIAPPKSFAEFTEGNKKKAELIGELAKSHPTDARLNTLLPTRWMALAQGGKLDDALAEVTKTIETTKDAGLKTTGHFFKAQITMAQNRGQINDSVTGAIDEFIKAAPTDPRGANLLYAVANQGKDPAKTKIIEDRILKDYDGSQIAGMIKGKRKQEEAVGKPFELEFTDAIKGTSVTMKGLKGKVVVIDFWATWCGPCIAEMPKMKKLYAEYKEKGVEFIGISLDQPKEAGGLDKLKDYVAKNEIGWPQYYQGKFWDGDFSKSWGVNSIPCVFIVDADGKLASVQARGKLEQMIPDLLKKAKNGPSTE